MSNTKIKRRNDIILLVGILLIGAILFFVVNMTTQTGGTVQIQVDGKVAASYPLSKDSRIPLEYNGYNLLEIKNGVARITKADCPDKLCTEQRPISRSGETITCLPHKTVIKVVEGDESEFDAVIE